MCLSIGAALGAGITYLAMKGDSAPVSDDVDDVSDDTVGADDLMDSDIEVHQSVSEGADEDMVMV